MKKIRFLSLLVFVFGTINFILACGVSGEEITLGVGESRIVDGRGLEVGCSGITLDCRCPEGLVCFWEGDAAATLWTDLPSSERLDFELHSNHSFEWRIRYDDYLITLIIVEPYPHKDIIIDPDEYTVTLDISSTRTGTEESTWSVIKALFAR